MYKYIYEQLNLIENYNPINEKQLVKLDNHVFERIVITSTGSSLKASLISRELLEIQSEKIIVSNPYDLKTNKKFLLEKGTLLIVISQTGESVNVLECQKYANEKGIFSISLTSGLNNSLSKNSEISFDMQCGSETIGPKTKGVTMTILALTDLIHKINLYLDFGEEIKKCISPSSTPLRINKIENQIVSFLDQHPDWSTSQALSIFGFGLDDYICREGSLKILETLLVPVMNYPGEEFMHGPHRLINEKQKFIVLNTQSDNYSNLIIKYAKEKNAKLLIISNDKGSDVLVTSWFEALVSFQLLAYYLPINIGINPDEPINSDFSKKVGSRT